MNISFEDSWKSWKAEYSKHRNGYNKDIWVDISRHPLDKIIDKLAQLYLEASTNQKTMIRESLKSGQIEPWDLTLYIRRVGLRLPLARDETLVKWGFWAAIIASEHVDPRDITVSLILMAVGAKKAEISIEDHLESAELTAIGNSNDLLTRALNQSESSVNITTKMFGPPEWKTTI